MGADVGTAVLWGSSTAAGKMPSQAVDPPITSNDAASLVPGLTLGSTLLLPSRSAYPRPSAAGAQIVGTAVLWGGGTAIGEIPPYAFSYHAAKAGHRNDEFDRMFQVGPRLRLGWCV